MTDPVEGHPNRRVVKRIEFNAAEKIAKAKSEAIDGGSFLQPVEGREFFYERLKNMRAPARGRLPSLEVFLADGGWLRLADALWDAGYRRLPEHEVVRWIPSAGMGGRVSEYDQGVYITRNEDGTWPSLDAVDYVDPDDIVIAKDEEDRTKFRATHTPTGLFALGKSRLKAQRALLEELEAIEDAANAGQDTVS
ncbi:hypothetical protein SEA_SPEEDDEMON_700 [Gordonia phage SpeedDemon]|uniref:Uncharacterized protein n=1 Tax=Gordonia phage Bantam TaxID=1887641 RepID=A0A1B3AYD5_9CAUD|nr:hypothetical protein BIZ77_gp111 [Gordonia phage Bantam]AOE43757.1 hypothetical protein SEA_BANTAM_68 [Gordonia phage Bantam]QNL30520.1 hypothetical protein SEA_SPEEDDEMON_700 [Gordonia phage SpeedDemon]